MPEPRELNDYYATPPYATQQLMLVETFDGDIVEPACGEGHISKVLQSKYQVKSFDLIDRGFGDVQDFFKYDLSTDNIITNPPYKMALEFILHSKKLAKKKIAMLLRTAFLESQSRYEMFQDKEFPLECIYQFSKRITLAKNDMQLNSAGTTAYAWFVWNKDFVGEPVIRWIK